MASLFQRCRPLLRASSQTSQRCASRQRCQPLRTFSSSTTLCKDDEPVFDKRFKKPKAQARQFPPGWEDVENSSYRLSQDSKEIQDDIGKWLSERSGPPKEMEYDEDGLDIDGLPRLAEGDVWIDKEMGLSRKMVQNMERGEPLQEEKGRGGGFWELDEEKDPVDEDPEFEGDDITSMAHGELEQHRELREFYRVIAWDMPLLYNHRKPFQAPTTTTPLRFRYTTYLGETHPASRKVVVDFTPSALPGLSQDHVTKLIKLLGARYNPSTDRAKMSCEMFPTPAQNKRWLGDMVDKLCAEAKDGKDMFQDLPFDFRHHKAKPSPGFPEAWKMTEERKAYLDEKRRAVEERENARLIELARKDDRLAAPSDGEQTEPVLVTGRNRSSRPMPTLR